jgi:hypothetical protein
MYDELSDEEKFYVFSVLAKDTSPPIHQVFIILFKTRTDK